MLTVGSFLWTYYKASVHSHKALLPPGLVYYLESLSECIPSSSGQWWVKGIFQWWIMVKKPAQVEMQPHGLAELMDQHSLSLFHINICRKAQFWDIKSIHNSIFHLTWCICSLNCDINATRCIHMNTTKTWIFLQFYWFHGAWARSQHYHSNLHRTSTIIKFWRKNASTIGQKLWKHTSVAIRIHLS
jgi:hypothetical protein